MPVPQNLIGLLAEHIARHTMGPHMFVNQWGHQLSPRVLDAAFRVAREAVVEQGLDNRFRFHDLRHYYASLLIATGADVKRVQASMRHTSATTTLNTYSHLWPDSDDSTRAAISVVIAARANSSADSLRTVTADGR